MLCRSRPLYSITAPPNFCWVAEQLYYQINALNVTCCFLVNKDDNAMEKLESLHSVQIIRKKTKQKNNHGISMAPQLWVHVLYDQINSFIYTPACLQSDCPVQETGHLASSCCQQHVWVIVSSFISPCVSAAKWLHNSVHSLCLISGSPTEQRELVLLSRMRVSLLTSHYAVGKSFTFHIISINQPNCAGFSAYLMNNRITPRKLT